MKWWLLALPLAVQAIQVATVAEQVGDPQDLVAEVIFSDADVICLLRASGCLDRRLGRFGYQSYRADEHCFFSRRRVIEHCGNAVYLRYNNRVFGIISEARHECPQRVKGCRVEGLVTCDDELAVEGRIAGYLYPETKQGLINQAARCEWCPHRKVSPPAPSHSPVP